MKKIIAILLTFAFVFTLGIPAFAAEEGAAEETEITQEEVLEIVQSEEFKEVLEEEGVDVEEFEEKIENGDYTVIEDSDEMGYTDKLQFVVELSGEIFLLSFSAGIMTGVMGLLFPGIIIVSIPAGICLFVAGVGTFALSPVIALLAPDSFFDN